ASTPLYTLSLHDALPIWTFLGLQPYILWKRSPLGFAAMNIHLATGCWPQGTLGSTYEISSYCRTDAVPLRGMIARTTPPPLVSRSEEHTSELQSRFDLVC